MTGAQAQLLSAAQISLWARVQNLEVAHVEQALVDRRLVKAAAMRRTLFLLPAKDLAVYVRGTAGRAEKGIGWARRKGVPEATIEAAIDAVLAALDEPLTRPEIAERVGRTLRVPVQEVQGGGWGSARKLAAIPVGEIAFPVWDLLHLAAAREVFCYGPARGKEPTFVRADAWIPGWQDVPREEAERLLLRRYLQAFGPATPEDFALWTGNSLRETRKLWAREGAGFAEVEVEGWKAHVLKEDLAALEAARLERPHVRLLPYFDVFLLGHKDRSHMLTGEYRARVLRPQGWVAPVVLVDGRAAGVWKHDLKQGRLLVEVEKFGPMARPAAARIREEAGDLARFLGAAGADVRIG
ncbi:MAG TPA: winged helix DNA-binding domain-containing protein [Anaerolineales bacterium]|nr:winged helix DNA-binding domain-containing protein [Anaerolineales bacterium]